MDASFKTVKIIEFLVLFLDKLGSSGRVWVVVAASDVIVITVLFLHLIRSSVDGVGGRTGAAFWKVNSRILTITKPRFQDTCSLTTSILALMSTTQNNI